MTARPEVTAEEGLTTVEMCKLTGATYRQVDYWTRRSYIGSDDVRGIGSGKGRRYTDRDIEIVRHTIMLISSGLHTRVAIVMAALVHDNGGAPIPLPGLIIVAPPTQD